MWVGGGRREGGRTRVSMEKKEESVSTSGYGSDCISSKLGLTASVSLAYLIQVLSVIDLEIVCDSNKLPNHLIDGWEEGC